MSCAKIERVFSARWVELTALRDEAVARDSLRREVSESLKFRFSKFLSKSRPEFESCRILEIASTMHDSPE